MTAGVCQEDGVVGGSFAERFMGRKSLNGRLRSLVPLFLVPPAAENPIARSHLACRFLHHPYHFIPVPDVHQVQVHFCLADPHKMSMSFNKTGEGEFSLKVDDLGGRADMAQAGGNKIENLDEFLNHLRIEFAEDYDAHKNKVFDLIRTTYSCTNSAEIELYYNNALTTISLAAADSVLKNRKLTKKQFLTKTKTKEVLYSVWRLQDLGKKKYCKELRKIHFTVTNIPPYARLFIIELNGTETKASIKDVLLEIRRKWSSHTIKRKLPQERYAPYILLLEIKPDLLAAIKSDFFDERICFTDGFPFREALFNTEALNKEQTDENQISLRFINEPALIHSTFSSLTKRTKEVYQFYITKPFGIVEDIKNIQIKIEDISYIREII